jgi:hypothetical protein
MGSLHAFIASLGVLMILCNAPSASSFTFLLYPCLELYGFDVAATTF